MKLVLENHLSPGDVLVMTAAIESLHAAYPGEYQTDVRSPVPDIWQNNPWITPIDDDDPDARRVVMTYPQIHQSNERLVNFLECYPESLGEAIARPLRLTTHRPHLYLSEDERTWMTMPQEHFTQGRRVPYAVLVGGTKHDYPAKQWPAHYYQAVVDATAGDIQWVQVGELSPEHWHPALRRVIPLVGRTTHRMLHRLAYHATLGLGPVTYLAHICAAFERPYICLAGGREPPTWVHYATQYTLHTIGQLPCCRTAACWKSALVPRMAGDQSLCELPVVGAERPWAQCMGRITPDEVITLVRRLLCSR